MEKDVRGEEAMALVVKALEVAAKAVGRGWVDSDLEEADSDSAGWKDCKSA